MERDGYLAGIASAAPLLNGIVPAFSQTILDHATQETSVHTLPEFFSLLMKLLARYRPAIICFHGTPSDDISRRWPDHMRRAETWRAEIEARAMRRRAIEDGRSQRIATADLLPQDWAKLSAHDLQTIIWTKPALALQDMLGVSNVAIIKRARKLGIPVPGRGFWNRVAFGKISHPQGIPPQIRHAARNNGPSAA